MWGMGADNVGEGSVDLELLGCWVHVGFFRSYRFERPGILHDISGGWINNRNGGRVAAQLGVCVKMTARGLIPLGNGNRFGDGRVLAP